VRFSLLVCLVLLAPIASAEDHASKSLRQGNWFVEVWTGVAKGFTGSTSDTSLWMAGGRAGKFLTDNLELDLEFSPAFFVFQEETVYGASFTPILLKLNLKRSGTVIPYLEGGAGILVTKSQVPERTSRFNFTPQAGFGLQIFSNERRAVRIGARYLHISNGGIAHRNPGINSMQAVLGLEWF
jgi:hypothetical protein